MLLVGCVWNVLTGRAQTQSPGHLQSVDCSRHFSWVHLLSKIDHIYTLSSLPILALVKERVFSLHEKETFTDRVTSLVTSL